MVNTRVKDPLRRQIINRKLGRQKQARMRQIEKTLRDPLDSEAPCRAEIHGLKVTEYKRMRESLTASSARE